MGVLVAATLLVLELVAVRLLEYVAPENGFGAVLLLGVMVISAGWDIRLAVAMSVLSTVAYAYVHDDDGGSIVAAVLIFMALALTANALALQARLRTAGAARLLRLQAALGTVATLVARNASPDVVSGTVVRELAAALECDRAALISVQDDAVLASYHHGPSPAENNGAPVEFDVDDMTARLLRSDRSAQVGDVVRAPVIVAGETRATLIVAGTRTGSMPPDTEAYVGSFADLVATAVSNAETRRELTASRARIVAAADQARRELERDLHDGVQQRIVSLALELRGVEDLVPDGHGDLRRAVGSVIGGIEGLHNELREISHGIHPAILSYGGVGSAVRSLARRAALPVTTVVEFGHRLPESVEVAAYYVVSESLTNATKHSFAESVSIRMTVSDGVLEVRISDDGIGGAATGAGTGIVGLTDRVAALGGRLVVDSPIGNGTAVVARIPLDESAAP